MLVVRKAIAIEYKRYFLPMQPTLEVFGLMHPEYNLVDFGRN